MPVPPDQDSRRAPGSDGHVSLQPLQHRMDSIGSVLPKKRQLPVLELFLLATLALGACGLAHHSVRWDEGLSAWAAWLPNPDTLRCLSSDVRALLNSLVLRCWWLLVGDGASVLRLPSVLVGTPGIPFVHRHAKSMGGTPSGMWAACECAVPEFAARWLQEARMHIMASRCHLSLSVWSLSPFTCTIAPRLTPRHFLPVSVFLRTGRVGACRIGAAQRLGRASCWEMSCLTKLWRVDERSRSVSTGERMAQSLRTTKCTLAYWGKP
jgi:hypothetical protein